MLHVRKKVLLGRMFSVLRSVAHNSHFLGYISVHRVVLVRSFILKKSAFGKPVSLIKLTPLNPVRKIEKFVIYSFVIQSFICNSITSILNCYMFAEPLTTKKTYPSERRGHYQIRINIMVLQIGISFSSVPGLNLISISKTLQSFLGHMHSPKELNQQHTVIPQNVYSKHQPRYSPTLHVVRQRDVIGPHVELPLAEAQNATVHAAGVDSDPHVHVHAQNFSDQTIINV